MKTVIAAVFSVLAAVVVRRRGGFMTLTRLPQSAAIVALDSRRVKNDTPSFAQQFWNVTF